MMLFDNDVFILFSLNVPLKHGMDDASYCKMFDSVFGLVNQNYQPDVIVVQVNY